MRSCRLAQVKSQHRRGVLLIETVVCGVLLAVVTAILVPALMGVRRQRQAMQQESLVLIELNNQEERLRVPGSDQSSELSDWFLKQYPGSKISIDDVTGLDLTAAASADSDEKTPPTENAVDQDAQKKSQNSVVLQARRLTIRCPMPASQPELVRSVVVWIPGSEGESTGAAEPSTTASEVTP
jgi:Tfp pilus assembly protein PilV